MGKHEKCFSVSSSQVSCSRGGKAQFTQNLAIYPETFPNSNHIYERERTWEVDPCEQSAEFATILLFIWWKLEND